MHKLLSAVAVAGLMLASSPAFAAIMADPAGDFLPTYIGPHQADLDVTSFAVAYDSVSSTFKVSAGMAGAIDLTLPGFYVIGVNTGAGTFPGPFAALGQPNVIFNTVMILRKTGASTVNGHNVTPTFTGNVVDVLLPLSFLPAATNGFTPMTYGFNIWPRSGAGGPEVISDFAPDNANLTAVPEPASWALMIAGLALTGGAMRRRRTAVAFG